MILTRIYELGKQTNACSANSRQHTKRKQQKTAAEVIIKKSIARKKLLEMTPDRVLQGHIYSGRHPRDIMLSGALVQSPLALEDLSSEHYGTK